MRHFSFIIRVTVMSPINVPGSLTLHVLYILHEEHAVQSISNAPLGEL